MPQDSEEGRGGGPDGCGSVRLPRARLVVLGGDFVNDLTTLRNGGRTLRAKDIAEERTEVELSLAMGINSEREVIETRCLVVAWGW
jgi:hypothetical protein